MIMASRLQETLQSLNFSVFLNCVLYCFVYFLSGYFGFIVFVSVLFFSAVPSCPFLHVPLPLILLKLSSILLRLFHPAPSIVFQFFTSFPISPVWLLLVLFFFFSFLFYRKILSVLFLFNKSHSIPFRSGPSLLARPVSLRPVPFHLKNFTHLPDAVVVLCFYFLWQNNIPSERTITCSFGYSWLATEHPSMSTGW